VCANNAIDKAFIVLLVVWWVPDHVGIIACLAPMAAVFFNIQIFC
jgi:hypothetical protein